MTTQLNEIGNGSGNCSTGQTTHDYRGRIVAGIALIVLGLFILAAQLFPTDAAALLFLPGLGVIFLAWGVAARTTGLLIPGGILTGLGAGFYLISGPLSGLPEESEVGVILLAFAAGWALISLLSRLVEDKFALWPLIPGGILALVGAAFLNGGIALQALELAGQFWPIALIGFGLYLLVRRQK